MNTKIIRVEKGKQYNSYNQEVIACSNGCGRYTTMTGTKLCDFCWEENRRKENNQAYITKNRRR